MATELLNVTSGDGRGASIALDGELVIGRSSAELPVLRADTEISRVHARIWRGASGELMIEDLGSRNGTFLNGSRIHGPHLLHTGDWLRTGRTTMELVEDEATDDAPRYDALVEHEAPAMAAASGSEGHIHLWPMAAILAALLAGGGIGAAVAASHRATARSTTVMVTRKVEQPAPPPPPLRLAAPARPAVIPPYPAGAREAFARAFCGHSATAPKGICGCTYAELARREPYSALVAQVAASHGRTISPAIRSAARTCGAQ